MMQAYKIQRGFVMLAAIFLVVLLAALGAFMVTFSNTQHLTSALDVQGSRAYWAARTGLEWAAGSSLAVAPTCPASPALLTVDGFSVSVTFICNSYDESGLSKTVIWMTAIASSGGNVGDLGYIERSLSATAEF